MKRHSKFTIATCISLLSFISIGCNPNSTIESKKDKESETLVEEDRVEDELITEYGLIESVEDGVYPMFVITVNFPERPMIQSFDLNAEDFEPRIENLELLQGKYATIKYTSNIKPILLDLKAKGKLIMGAGKIDPYWKRISGKLTGAKELTNSDLPGAIKISNDSESIEFPYYVDEDIQAVNEQRVEANYTLRSINMIKSIIPSLEAAPEEPAEVTVDKDSDAPEEAYPSGSMMVNNSYLILQSTKSYSAAMHTAKQASAKLGLPIDNRGNVFEFKDGLKDTTICGCGETHGYVPRGRFDDGNYISIEHTNSFTEFTNGYYIAVAASGDRQQLKPLLPKAKEFLADAYIKDAEVYIGCMH
jgi:hypothetical protein